MAGSLRWDKQHDWFWEGNIQKKIVEHLISSKFEILSEANTYTKNPGPDILARHNGNILQISVKGYPSDKYTGDFPGGRKGQKKRTQPSTQARHWFSEALFELILAKSQKPQLGIALGLPRFQTYVNYVTKIRWLREKVDLLCYFVDSDGKVELILPSS